MAFEGSQGLGAGIAGAVILPVAGVTVGVTQMVRGIANTPEAVKERYWHKKVWNEEERRWTSDGVMARYRELFGNHLEEGSGLLVAVLLLLFPLARSLGG